MCHQDSCAVWKKFHREFVELLQVFPYRSCHSSKIFLISSSIVLIFLTEVSEFDTFIHEFSKSSINSEILASLFLSSVIISVSSADIKNRKVRKYKNQLVHESDFDKKLR